ncbi:MAG: IS21 family transposase [Gammaproteobacteria bacterium]|nr:IS21 family transposase [Gammaproteobacteria bacterium]
MRQLREILKLKYETGMPHRAIAAACGVGAGTVSTYVQRALEAGLSWPLPETLDDAALEALLFTRGPVAGAARTNPCWADVHRELKRPGVTLQLLWLEYCEQHPHGYRYSQFCELYRRWRGKLAPSMRQVHRPGEKVFVDFSGKRAHLVDRDTGELIAVELFVAVVGASSYTYAEAVASQKLHEWIGVNTRMLEHMQGSPAIVVPDNLKSAVTKACRYEPLVNRTYDDFAAHYDAVIIPTRSFKPKDKAKVESGVLVAQRWLLARLRDRVFFDITALNEAIAELCDELNDRPMRRLGVSRRELFEQLDRPALKPLPSTRYEIAHWKVVRVNIDYHVDLERNLYSVPYQLLGEKLEARYTTTLVELYRNGRRIASHRRRHGRGAVATVPEHMPAAHRAHAQWTPSRLIGWAAKSGPATAGLVTELLAHKRHPEQGYRACLGIMRLGKRFGAERLEAACERALHMKSFTYQTVKNILSSGFDKMPITAPSSASPSPQHDNIRGPQYYLFNDTENA